MAECGNPTPRHRLRRTYNGCYRQAKRTSGPRLGTARRALSAVWTASTNHACSIGSRLAYVKCIFDMAAMHLR